ncbi:hypothetical protein OIO90_005206 [Microbotryomycetes sp. JL221]|nr:hypothetical protein OIO90_005206 [Microbotryomycetes sp. JL221]
MSSNDGANEQERVDESVDVVNQPDSTSLSATSTKIINDPQQPSSSSSAAAAVVVDSNANETTSTTTIEQELSNVLTGLGSFWGRVRKQSAQVYQQAEKQLDKASKDLTPLLTQAKQNLEHISEQTRQELNRLAEQPSTTTGVVIGPDGFPILLDDVPDESSSRQSITTATTTTEVDQQDVKGKQVDPREHDSSSQTETEDGDRDRDSINPQQQQTFSTTPTSDAIKSSSQTALNFISKLQNQISSNENFKGLNKNLQHLQNEISTNLNHSRLNVSTNLIQLQEQFKQGSNELVNEGEIYLTKGEHWLQEFSQEVARLARETVKVVPPSSSTTASSPLVNLSNEERLKRREDRLKRAEETSVGRRELLLRELRLNDQQILLNDPRTDQQQQQQHEGKTFQEFEQSIDIDSNEWSQRIQQELMEGGDVLNKTFQLVVPDQVSEHEFWKRYFYRVEQIDQDEKRRKQILQTEVGDDDFSWDMDDEDESQTSAVTSPRLQREDPLSSSKQVDMMNDDKETLNQTPTESKSTKPIVELDNAKQKESSTSVTTAKEIESKPTHMMSMTSHHDHQSKDNVISSPRTSSDGTSSYDIVGETSGAPSEKGDESISSNVVPSSAGDDSDSDWE